MPDINPNQAQSIIDLSVRERDLGTSKDAGLRVIMVIVTLLLFVFLNIAVICIIIWLGANDNSQIADHLMKPADRVITAYRVSDYEFV